MFTFRAMASSHRNLEEDLKCSICLDIFKEPVVLDCSHSFCKVCLENRWRTAFLRNCPICRATVLRSVDNVALKGICESFVAVKRRRICEQNQGSVCTIHMKKHNMFCTDDRQLVCLSCVTEDHQNHNFCSISKAAEDHRRGLQGPLWELEKKLESLMLTKTKCIFSPSELQDQIQQTENQIKKVFEKFHQFLREEEQVRIHALRDEEQKKKQEVMKKTAETEKLIFDLTERINQIKEDLKHEDSLFLHKFRETENRVKLSVPDPELGFKPLLDVAKYLGNLKFSLWQKMKNFCPRYPVVLDPNTQISNLQISQDLTFIKLAPTPGLQNPLKPCHEFILGSEGFSSGVHTWQVNVESCQHWALGISKGSQNPVLNISNSPNIVSVINGKCSWSPTVPNIKKVQVDLNMGTGQLRFTDPDTNTVLQMMIGDFTEKMYPCFFIYGNSSLRILPAAAF